MTLPDSGERESFDTGAVRDIQVGKGRYDLLPPEALRRIAVHYEKGALKYSDRNWEKGMPCSRFCNSALRHIFQWLQGDSSEDHLAAAAFNIMGIMAMESWFDATPSIVDVGPHAGEALMRETKANKGLD